MLNRPKPCQRAELGWNHLLLERLPPVRAVPRQNLLTSHRRWDEEPPIAFDVQNVERNRMNIGGCQIAEGQARGIRIELRNQTGLLLGRKGAKPVHEVGRKLRIVLRPRAHPLVGHGRDRFRRSRVRQPDRKTDSGVGVGRVARLEPLALQRAEERRPAPAQRPADRQRRIVAPELRFLEAGSVDEELVGIHLLVLEVVTRRARVVIRARSRDELDVAAAIPSARCRRQRRLDLHLLQCVERNRDAVAQAPAGIEHVRRVDAIDSKPVVGRAGAVDAGIERLRCIVSLRTGRGRDVEALSRAIRQRRIDAGFADDDVGVVSRGGRQVAQRFFGKGRRLRRRGDVQRDLGGHHVDAFGQPTDLECHGPRRHFARVDSHDRLRLGKSLETETDDVFARPQ